MPSAAVDDPSTAVVRALLTRPELAPAALIAAAPHGHVPLTADGWVAVARLVQERLLGGPIEVGFGHPADTDAGGAADDGGDPDPDPGAHAGSPPPLSATVARLVARVLAAPVTRLLPRGSSLWRDVPPADREAVARLAVLCAAPHAARDATVVEAVARALNRTAPADAATAERHPRPDPPRPATEPPTEPATEPPTEPATEPASAAAEPATRGTPPGAAADVTELGGLLFLIPVMTELDLPAATTRPGSPLSRREFGWVAARLARLLSGAEADDPAVRVLAGPGPEDEDAPPPQDDERAALAALAARITGVLRERLRLDPDDVLGGDSDGDLDRLWRRRATVVAEPGWIEAEFALADVDVRVRVAGLDLDPGFVWWLGAVVRIRYV